ncbi:uncharacterized protein [Cicer arietinum]|uniref:Gibberellin-regulated protein 14 n=1 Tax=Cicer arietinum TaxID=3827 RepID=A0A1S2XJV3_CICAR|nr:gibberellin-regulated protein 14 [Cicer arietinum]
MLHKMVSKSIFLLGIFLVVATKVFSYDEDLKIVVNYAIKAPTPVVTIPTPPSQGNAPPTPPIVKAPSPPPIVKTPPYQSPPIVKAPTPPPYVKVPPPPQPPIVNPPLAPTPPPTPIVKSLKDCIPLCGYRCQLHSRKNLCLRACMTCCDRCKCVPPGTYGNREKCGKCYTDMLTHGNKFKCP